MSGDVWSRLDERRETRRLRLEAESAERRERIDALFDALRQRILGAVPTAKASNGGSNDEQRTEER